MRTLAATVSALIFFASGVAAAQDEPKDPRPDVLVLGNAMAPEPGCDSTSYVANGFCLRNRAEKADRWLKAVLKSCLAKAAESDRMKKEVFVDWGVKDAAISLQRSQDAFERYREEASQSSYDAAYPGLLAAAYHWGRYFQLTVERATMLLRLPVGSEPLAEIDLTKTDWCE